MDRQTESTLFKGFYSNSLETGMASEGRAFFHNPSEFPGSVLMLDVVGGDSTPGSEKQRVRAAMLILSNQGG